MQKYMLIYHGGGKPADAAAGEKIMADWRAWVADMGDALAEPGGAVGKSQTVTADGGVRADGGANPAGGYCIITAKDAEDAAAKAKAHPFLSLGGSIEVAPLWDKMD
ncbi:MAG: hypothetical protein OD817_08840 [Gammaproteobacteria bacterium]